MSNYDAWLEPPDPKPEGTCPECEGESLVDNRDYSATYSCDCTECDCIERLKRIDCPKCDGTGEVELEECSSCGYFECQCDAAYESWRDSQYD